MRTNALNSLRAQRFPQIVFRATDVAAMGDGYRLNGTLEIAGVARGHLVNVRVDDLGRSWRMTSDAEVRQSDYRIKPHSLLMGVVKVADTVTVSFNAVRAKGD
ncbi:MAG: YceI family protein [Mycobacteriaceae bacterium]|nr:YceI family protein [Mycobacteriaceae bacterium]